MRRGCDGNVAEVLGTLLTERNWRDGQLVLLQLLPTRTATVGGPPCMDCLHRVAERRPKLMQFLHSVKGTEASQPVVLLLPNAGVA